MRFSFVIRTAAYIALSGGIILVGLLYLLQYLDPHSLWVEILVIFLFVVAAFALVVFFLRRFLVQQFNFLFHLIDGGKLTEKELEVLSGKEDALSDIRKKMLQWSSEKATEIDQLKQMEKYRKEYLGNVSHELKTPIFNIQGYILTLLDGGLEDKTVNRLYLERTEKSINRMIHIVEDLESISRLESGGYPMEYTSFDMVPLVEEVFEMDEMTARTAKIKLEVEKKQVRVYADRKRILEVMNNLVANSIKYGKKNGMTRVFFTEKDQSWRISVADNGIGIAESDQKRIFERFYRCDKARSSEQGGTGLGLAIAKHIVEAHGQAIQVESASNKGSVFSFSLEKGK